MYPQTLSSLISGDRTEYSSYTEADACSQCKARGLASSCKPQYDPRDGPSPEPDTDLRARVARLESALMSLTGRSSPSAVSISTPPRREYSIGTTVASGTDAELRRGKGPAYLNSSNDNFIPLYSVLSQRDLELTVGVIAIESYTEYKLLFLQYLAFSFCRRSILRYHPTTKLY